MHKLYDYYNYLHKIVKGTHFNWLQQNIITSNIIYFTGLKQDQMDYVRIIYFRTLIPRLKAHVLLG